MAFVWIQPLGYWIGKYEVTNAEYRHFKSDHTCADHDGVSLNADRQPAAFVSYSGAMAFAQWASRLWEEQLPQGYRVRLPDAREWTAIAQCGDDRRFPWGNTWPPKYGNYRGQEAGGTSSKIEGYNDGYVGTCPVEKSGRNDWGLYGVGGNVCEWTREWRDAKKTHRIMRGGAWIYGNKDNLLCSDRNYHPPESAGLHTGFRVVVTSSAPAPQLLDTDP